MLEYEVEREQLGEGGFGKVFRARRRVDGMPLVVKQTKDGLSNVEMQFLLQEAQLMRKISHPNIVQYHDSFR